MADARSRRKRPGASEPAAPAPELYRLSIQLSRRTAGVLSHYARVHRMTVSEVIEESLTTTLRGYRIYEPGASASEEKAAG